jgi:hypothetical protein
MRTIGRDGWSVVFGYMRPFEVAEASKSSSVIYHAAVHYFKYFHMLDHDCTPGCFELGCANPMNVCGCGVIRCFVHVPNINISCLACSNKLCRACLYKTDGGSDCYACQRSICCACVNVAAPGKCDQCFNPIYGCCPGGTLISCATCPVQYCGDCIADIDADSYKMIVRGGEFTCLKCFSRFMERVDLLDLIKSSLNGTTVLDFKN